MRTIRDILRPSIEEIIVDSDQSYERAKTLLSVVAPRTAPTVVRYRLSVPIFHAFDIERAHPKGLLQRIKQDRSEWHVVHQQT